MIGFDELYSWVRDLPIIDWHNHLDLDMLAEDKPLGSLYEVWVKADPYKHRAMRICGEPEELITGHGQDARCPSNAALTGATGVSPVGSVPPGATGILPVGSEPPGATGVLPVGSAPPGATGILPVGSAPPGATGILPVGSAPPGATGILPVAEPEKWAAWMRTLPKLVGNPLFAWARQELEFLRLDPEPYLRGNGANISLSDWTPSKLLKAFNVEWLSPCLGQRASCPLVRQGAATGETPVAPVRAPTGETPVAPVTPPSLGQRASRPLVATSPLGQRASRPLVWTPPTAWFSPTAGEDVSSHFSHILATGDHHRRSFPHIGQNGTLVFVTFRLGDSLPAERLAELEEMRREQQSVAKGQLKLTHEQLEKIDAWLDAGHGSCVLADARCRQIVEDALAFFDAESHGQDARGPSNAALTGATGVSPVGSVPPGATGVSPVGSEPPGATGVSPVARTPAPRYRLHGYVVMPNHVHVLLELFEAEDLAGVLHSWKSYTAKAINRELGTTGPVWREEYYDRLIRDGEHYENVLAYLRKNEAAARGIARARGAATGETPVAPVRTPTGETPVAPVCTPTGETPVAPVCAPTGETPVAPVCTSTGETPVGPVCAPTGETPVAPVRTPTGETPVAPVRTPPLGQRESCPLVATVTGATGVSPVGPVCPSLRMTADEAVSLEVLSRFQAGGCRIVDISVDDAALLETHFESLQVVASFAAAHGWTMLLHLGALRETSARLRAAAGPAGGFAGMCAPVDPAAVARFLDRLERSHGQDARGPSESAHGQDARGPSVGVPTGATGVSPVAGSLPRTILLSLNPEAHAQLAVLAGSFNGAGMPGKVQLGPAWWWCDHEEGIRDVLEKNAAYGVLSTFVGMTTDSRSLLSFVRHDYFRRILCRWTAEKVAAGAFPNDAALLRPMLENICYLNARNIVMLNAQECAFSEKGQI